MKTSNTRREKKERFVKKAYTARLTDFEDIRSQLNDIVKKNNEMLLPALTSPAEFFRLFEDTEKKVIELGDLRLRLASDELLLITENDVNAFCDNLLSIKANGIASRMVHKKNNLQSVFSKSKSSRDEFWLAAVALKEIFDFEHGQVAFKKDFHAALKLFFIS